MNNLPINVLVTKNMSHILVNVMGSCNDVLYEKFIELKPETLIYDSVHELSHNQKILDNLYNQISCDYKKEDLMEINIIEVFGYLYKKYRTFKPGDKVVHNSINVILEIVEVHKKEIMFEQQATCKVLNSPIREDIGCKYDYDLRNLSFKE